VGQDTVLVKDLERMGLTTGENDLFVKTELLEDFGRLGIEEHGRFWSKEGNKGAKLSMNRRHGI
jgi:hypothetical protein